MIETSGSSKKAYVLIKLRTSWLISTRTNGLISRKCLVKNRPSGRLGWGEIHGLGTQPRAGGLPVLCKGHPGSVRGTPGRRRIPDPEMCLWGGGEKGRMSLNGAGPPSSVSLLNAQLLKPFSGSITGDEGMPGGQVKPLVSITFERESARMGETGLQNQLEIYCVKGKKKPKQKTKRTPTRKSPPPCKK